MVGANGTLAGHVNRMPKTPKPRATGTPRKSRKSAKHGRRLAYGIGSVGVGVLSLSVAHCTESIVLLTGSHWLLAGLLAIGIDAGMVLAELAELAVVGSNAEQAVKPWARGYTVAAVLLSVLLNGYAFGLHASSGMVWAAWILGAFVPAAVYALGRVAGNLWTNSAE